MKKVREKLKAVVSAVVNSLYESILRRRLRNHDFSILCSNCAGGVISHRLGKKIPFSHSEFVDAAAGFYETGSRFENLYVIRIRVCGIGV